MPQTSSLGRAVEQQGEKEYQQSIGEKRNHEHLMEALSEPMKMLDGLIVEAKVELNRAKRAKVPNVFDYDVLECGRCVRKLQKLRRAFHAAVPGLKVNY